MDYGSSFGGGFGHMGGQERMAPFAEIMFVEGAHQLYGLRTVPGADKVFFDKNEDVFYVVCTNHYGQPQIKAYCFEEIKGPETSEQYVTKHELREMIQELLGKGGGGDGK